MTEDERDLIHFAKVELNWLFETYYGFGTTGAILNRLKEDIYGVLSKFLSKKTMKHIEFSIIIDNDNLHITPQNEETKEVFKYLND